MNFLNLPDTRLAYSTHGTGAPVILIQGVGVAGTAWTPQVEAIGPEFQAVTYDNRGLGQSTPCSGPITIESMAADAQALMDHLGWSTAHVVGHSMGGVIAQQLALDAPKRVRSLSLLCTFPRGKDAARPTPRILWMSLRTRLGTRRMRRRAFLELILAPDEIAQSDTDDLAARFAPLLGRDLADQPAILMKQLGALGRHDVLARLGELGGIPTWVASAELDPIAPPEFGRRLADAIPGARFESFAGVSHAVTLHQPERINQALLAFLRGVESRADR
ncbi:MAG: alpha/beta fold hydrolase [Limisphaerales bacterium]